MELTLAKRAIEKKAETKKIRREGNIPAILYSKGKEGVNGIVNGVEFQKALNKLEPNTVSAHVFTLKHEGKSIKAIIKDIQYDITTYKVIHLDFEELHNTIPVTLKVPVVLTNAVECAGVKLGGILRQVVRNVKVRCLPKDIPAQFDLDVGELLLGQTIKLNKIEIPKGVHPISKLNEVAAVVARR